MKQRLRAGEAAAEAPAESESGAARLRSYLFYVEPRVDPVVLWARALVWVGFSAWGLWFVGTEYDAMIGGLPPINYSFMHRIDLVFHEAGHLLFIPLGNFMAVLGGSLAQVLMPAIVLGFFLFKYHNPFGASIALWWLAQSTMDVAPYINDAPVQQMILLGGVTGRDAPGYHDWNNILGRLGMLDTADELAAFVDLLGEALMLAAIAWGAYCLYLQWRSRERRP